MKRKAHMNLTTLLVILLTSQLTAGQYYVLCEGNFGQANASLWSFDESLSTASGPLIWNSDSNPLGDVGQSLTLYHHKLYIIMNNSHEIRILDLENGPNHIGDLELPGASPRFMAVQHSQDRGFISSWNLGGILIADLTTDTIVDTLLLEGLPEELLIDNDRLFISMALHSDWSPNNQVLEFDISAETPTLIQTYTVIDGPGSMAITNNVLYVSSIYYNLAWESFTGTSSIDLANGSVFAVDHGTNINYSADIDILQGVPYRIYGNSIVPINEDLSFNSVGSIGDNTGLYSFSVQNNMFVVSTSDFVAPDDVLVYSPTGQNMGSLTVGALPGDVIYYDPDIVSVDQNHQRPGQFILGNNYPNPFNPTTRIPFQLRDGGQISMNIFNLKGQLVISLLNADLEQGHYEVRWDGINANGHKVSSGIYFAVLSSGSDESLIKMDLIQ